MDKKAPVTKKKALPKKPAPFLTIDNTNMPGWLMSCFFVCGCMFFLGVLVGRNTAPVQFDVDLLEEKLSNLQVSVLNQKNPEKSKNPKQKNQNPDLTAEPELSIVYDDIIDKLTDKGNSPEIYEQYVPPVFTPKYTKTPPTKQKPTPVKKTGAPEPEKQAVTSKPTVKSEPVAVLKPEIRSHPSAVAAPSVQPESITGGKSIPAIKQDMLKITKSKPTDQRFAIQVASLKSPEKAKLLMNKFKEKGYPAFCQCSEINGATWHRVRIGPYPDRAMADKDQDRLKAAGVDSLMISIN